MASVTFNNLDSYIKKLLSKVGMTSKNAVIMSDIYLETTKRGIGHHDIYDFPSRIEAIKAGKVKPNPEFKLLSSFGGMERWDGDNGLGELISCFAMDRAIELASEHGMGFCTFKNSNHYLCSAPYVVQAARQGYIGLMIAKGIPSMGIPGVEGNIVGQSPIGYAFPTGSGDPVMLDICLAYASGGKLMYMAKEGIPIMPWWGVDKEGKPTSDAFQLLRGTRYPIGEHKGFGLAILCELLTGVLSGGLILDENENEEWISARSTSHTAIAIKADALMDMDEYGERSGELIKRLKSRADGVRIPGERSWEKTRGFEMSGIIELKDELYEKLKGYAIEYGIECDL